MDNNQAIEKLAKTYEAGKVLFNEGDEAGKVWVINEGHVRISKLVCEEEVELEILGPGEYCGELALLQKAPQTVTATVVDNAKLLCIEAAQFEQLIRANGELSMRMLKKLSGRLAEAQFRISVLQMRSNLGRVMMQLRAEAANNAGKIPENLAEHLGLDEVELEVVLDKLVSKKLINLKEADHSFEILDDTEYERYMRYVELNDRYAYFEK